jgi:hypothetical protein
MLPKRAGTATQRQYQCAILRAMKRVERVRLYPTRRQQEQLLYILDVTRELHNAALEERREAKRRGVRVTGKQQYAELTALR